MKISTWVSAMLGVKTELLGKKIFKSHGKRLSHAPPVFCVLTELSFNPYLDEKMAISEHPTVKSLPER